MRVTAKTPTTDTLEKVRISKAEVEGTAPKEVRCPFCGRLLVRKYPDTKGHIDGKCGKCGKEMVIDLLCWRRSRHKR